MKKYMLIALICILTDQIAKFLAKKYLIISTNTGAIFGILQNQTALIIVLTFFVLGFLIYYTNKLNQIGLGLIFAGLVGNLIDRLIYSYVIDFIKISIWPAFNLADLFLLIGIIIILRRSNL